MITERPILFSEEMVQAIRWGRKTVTRRVIKNVTKEPNGCGDVFSCIKDEDGLPSALDYPNNCDHLCPYGQPGDKLWVRETWATTRSLDHVPPHRLAPGSPLEYKADRCLTISGGMLPDRGRWRPSIHMPRIFSRILLEITEVRTERLQHITGMDAKREGISPLPHMPQDGADLDYCRREFKSLWDSINGKPRADGVDISWDANPWVWVVGFKAHEERPRR